MSFRPILTSHQLFILPRLISPTLTRLPVTNLFHLPHKTRTVVPIASLLHSATFLPFFNNVFRSHSFHLETSPSIVRKLRFNRTFQDQPSQRILDDRPEPDLLLSPTVSLLFAGFGEFLDAVNRQEDEFALDLMRLELEWDVDSFAVEMSKISETETDRRTAGLRALNKNLSSRGPDKLIAAAIGSDVSDGHFDGTT
ncbi:hypothetical protein BC827DRAFT_1159408 [Russula dissimulans]|nr:hypothetical protein BC827DRAFT_1159408 [Russula dissimulans]